MTQRFAPDIAVLLDLLDDEVPSAIELRHRLHLEPEVGGHEDKTPRLVADALDAPDAPWVTQGRIVRIGADSGPAIALRAELDALPGRETSGLPWASGNGATHMCGHDIHMAALVAACRTLRRAQAPVPVVAILQPREELAPGGAVDMMASPVLGDHDIAAVLAVHVQPRLAVGTFSAAGGAVNASADEFTITILGQPGHGAYPHVTRDPIVAAAAVVTALQHLVSRTTDPMKPVVITIGTIHGGEAPNAVPSSVIMTGTLRTFEDSERARLHAAIASCAELTAQAYGCSAEVIASMGEPPLVNDAALAQAVTRGISATGLVSADPLRSCGADDFACYGDRYPIVMVFYGVGTGAPGEPGLHHPSFAPDDSHVRGVAAALLAAYVATCEELSAELLG